MEGGGWYRPGVRGGGMVSLGRRSHRDAMEETGAAGVSQLGTEYIRDSLVSQGSLENGLEGPAYSALERAGSCSVSSLVLLKTEAAGSPCPAPLLSLTEGFWSRMDSPLQRSTCSAPQGTDGRGGLTPGFMLGDTCREKALLWPFREPGDWLVPEALTYSRWAELGCPSRGEGHRVPPRRFLQLFPAVLSLWLLRHRVTDVETSSQNDLNPRPEIVLAERAEDVFLSGLRLPSPSGCFLCPWPC